jgi:hypothetical protein
MRTWIALASAGLLIAETGIAPIPTYTAAEKRHWAFQPLNPPAIPTLQSPWARSPIDALVLDKMRQDGASPAPPADRATLLRRATFDVWGVPPTPEAIDAFVRDRSPQAWETVVDRLLEDPQYGERWAQHWLDVVRFAETDGFEYDTHRREAWRYRDYVIQSLNSNKPYDVFVKEQLAGDEINPRNETLRVAAGFQRLGALRKNAGNQEVASSRNEVLTEMTNVVGAALLGVTLGCARCHDHKFDAIRQSDYYRIQAYFAATHESEVPLASEAERAAWIAKAAPVESQLKKLRAEMKKLQGDPLARMEKRVKEVEAQLPEPLPSLYSVSNDAAKATPIHLLARGDYQSRGAAVGMRPLGILTQEPELPLGTENPRTKLAAWIMDPANPLPARVMANRLWQHHFAGQGIVGTPNDFGRMGNRPAHRELLDYLAAELRDGGWDLKRIHRQILMSNTYQQSVQSAYQNIPLPRRQRLDGEQLRDSMLAVSGLLNAKAGGPSVMIPVDPELVNLLYKPGQWQAHPDTSEHHRRSVYLLQKRNLRLPFMEVFDSPDRALSCARRDSSTHAPQALEMLNGAIANECAQAFAARLEREAKTPEAKVTRAWRLAMGRLPSPQEKQLALQFLRTQPLSEFALAIFNSNGFQYVD